jgi:hypothetical protein
VQGVHPIRTARSGAADARETGLRRFTGIIYAIRSEKGF